MLPVVPGPDRPLALLHKAVDFREELDVCLAENKLLGVAQTGADPDEAVICRLYATT